jgi:hypothetical protein
VRAVFRRCVEVGGRIRVHGRFARCDIRRRTLLERVLDRVGAQRGRPHIDERDPGGAADTRRNHPDDRVVLRPPIELLEAEAVRTGLGYTNLRQQLVGFERGFEESSMKVVRGNVALTIRTSHHEGRFEREQRGREIGRGIAMGDRPADRSPVADLVVADLRRDRPQHTAFLREDVVRLEIAVPRERADRDVITGIAHERQVAHAPYVDDDGRRREPQLHERQQRHSAGEELRVFTMLADQRDRFFG